MESNLLEELLEKRETLEEKESNRKLNNPDGLSVEMLTQRLNTGNAELEVLLKQNEEIQNYQGNEIPEFQKYIREKIKTTDQSELETYESVRKVLEEYIVSRNTTMQTRIESKKQEITEIEKLIDEEQQNYESQIDNTNVQIGLEIKKYVGSLYQENYQLTQKAEKMQESLNIAQKRYQDANTEFAHQLYVKLEKRDIDSRIDDSAMKEAKAELEEVQANLSSINAQIAKNEAIIKNMSQFLGQILIKDTPTDIIRRMLNGEEIDLSSKEPKTPVEPKAPTEEPKTPVEPKAPTEEPKTPVEQKAPTEEPKTPVEPKAPTGEPKPPVELKAPTGEPKTPVEPKAPTGGYKTPVEPKAPTGEPKTPVEPKAPTGEPKTPSEQKVPTGGPQIPTERLGDTVDSEEEKTEYGLEEPDLGEKIEKKLGLRLSPEGQEGFTYKVSEKGIFYNGKAQDIDLLNEIINERLVNTLTNVFGLEKGRELFDLGDRYLMAAIINNTTEEVVKSKLENYYNTILNNRDNDNFIVAYDLKETSLFSRLRNKSNIFNNGSDLAYFKDMAYMGRDFSEIRANTGIKLEFAMRDILGKVKNIFRRVEQRKLEEGKEQGTSENGIVTTGKEQDTSENSKVTRGEKQETPEESIITTGEEQETPKRLNPIFDSKEEMPDFANNNGKDTYQRLQVLFSYLDKELTFKYRKSWNSIIENALKKGEISQAQCDSLIQGIKQIENTLLEVDKIGAGINYGNGNTVYRNTTIQKAYEYQGNQFKQQEKSFREKMKTNPLFTQLTTMIGDATSNEELRAWKNVTELYSLSYLAISDENKDQLYGQIEERKKALELSQGKEESIQQPVSQETGR